LRTQNEIIGGVAPSRGKKSSAGTMPTQGGKKVGRKKKSGSGRSYKGGGTGGKKQGVKVGVGDIATTGARD